jgi:hypothetical protein
VERVIFLSEFMMQQLSSFYFYLLVLQLSLLLPLARLLPQLFLQFWTQQLHLYFLFSFYLHLQLVIYHLSFLSPIFYPLAVLEQQQVQVSSFYLA